MIMTPLRFVMITIGCVPVSHRVDRRSFNAVSREGAQ